MTFRASEVLTQARSQAAIRARRHGFQLHDFPGGWSLNSGPQQSSDPARRHGSTSMSFRASGVLTEARSKAAIRPVDMVPPPCLSGRVDT